MKKVAILISAVVLIFALFPDLVLAVEGRMTVTDKEILERLHSLDLSIARLEEGQKNLAHRIDGMDKRIDGLAGRIDGLTSRIDGLTNMIMGGFIAVFVAIFSLIGFVIWDRRTVLSPVISKTRELEADKDLAFKILREYAQKEPKMAEVLKALGLL